MQTSKHPFKVLTRFTKETWIRLKVVLQTSAIHCRGQKRDGMQTKEAVHLIDAVSTDVWVLGVVEARRLYRELANLTLQCISAILLIGETQPSFAKNSAQKKKRHCHMDKDILQDLWPLIYLNLFLHVQILFCNKRISFCKVEGKRNLQMLTC